MYSRDYRGNAGVTQKGLMSTKLDLVSKDSALLQPADKNQVHRPALSRPAYSVNPHLHKQRHTRPVSKVHYHRRWPLLPQSQGHFVSLSEAAGKCGPTGQTGKTPTSNNEAQPLKDDWTHLSGLWNVRGAFQTQRQRVNHSRAFSLVSKHSSRGVFSRVYVPKAHNYSTTIRISIQQTGLQLP